MQGNWRWTLIGLAGAAGASVAVYTATAQNRVAAPVLHEDLSPPADQVARTESRAKNDQAILGPEPSEFRNPQAISSGPKLLPEPRPETKAADGEPIFGGNSFGSKRENEARPDYATGADGTLHYVEVFNPSVVPFKRMTSLDAVSPDYTMVTDTNSTTDIVVGGNKKSRRELFWGSLMVNLETGREIAIPSVSPEMGILSYEVEPKVGLIFSKDRADNYYVRTDEAGTSGQFRLIFLADASPDHFVARVGPETIASLPRRLLQPMPESVRKVAQRGLNQLNLTSKMRLRVALNVLVQYFRNFEAKDPPPPSGDIYWDLFVNQAGVCRHRAFAFMVTANALGIPTRYLANEAHAWVEVFAGKGGWVRVDLGGAALRLEVTGAEDKAMHQPRGTDPFPKPPSYADNYTQLVGDIDGLTEEQIAERQTPPPGSSGGQDASGSSPDGDSTDGDFFAKSDQASGPDGRDSSGRLIGPGKGLPTVPAEELVGKKRTVMVISEVSATGYRGESMHISGSVTAEGEPAPGLFVNLFLMPAGSEKDDGQRIGYTTTAADGTFDVTIEIPASTKLMTYEVFASTPGDPTYSPSLSPK